MSFWHGQGRVPLSHRAEGFQGPALLSPPHAQWPPSFVSAGGAGPSAGHGKVGRLGSHRPWLSHRQPSGFH